jgi:hypothetical protein
MFQNLLKQFFSLFHVQYHLSVIMKFVSFFLGASKRLYKRLCPFPFNTGAFFGARDGSLTPIFKSSSCSCASYAISCTLWKGCHSGLTSCHVAMAQNGSQKPVQNQFFINNFFATSTNQLTMSPLYCLLIFALLMCAGLHPNPGPSYNSSPKTIIQFNCNGIQNFINELQDFLVKISS